MKLLDWGSKAWDQVNPFDNGRTWQQRRPTNQGSVIQQATHNGLTNATGNMIIKPAANTVGATAVEPIRWLLGAVTQNNPAMQAAQTREMQALKNSIPGALFQQGVDSTKGFGDLAFRAPVLDVMGKTNEASRVRQEGAQAFNKTMFGQATRPLQFGAANLAGASKKSQQQVGLDTNATGAQKWFADPALGAAALYGLARAGGALPKGVKTTAKTTAETATKPVSEMPKVVDPANADAAFRAIYKAPATQVLTSSKKLFTKGATTGSKDALDIMVNGLANTTDYKTITNAVKTLVPNVDKATQKGIVKGLAKANTPQAVADTLWSASKYIDNSTPKSIKLNQMDANLRPLTPVKETKSSSAKAPKTEKVTPPPAEPQFQTPVNPQKLGFFDSEIRSALGSLKKVSPDLANAIARRSETGDLSAARAKSRSRTVDKLNSEEEANWVSVLQGKEAPMNETVARAAAEARKEFDMVYKQSQKHGIEVPGYRQNYFPQIVDPKTFIPGTKQYKEAVQHLVESKQANSPAHAKELLAQNKDAMNPYARPNVHVGDFGNLTERRTLDLPTFSKTKAAYHQYLDKSYANIAHNKVFGAKDEALNQLLDNIKASGGDYEAALKAYRTSSNLVKGSERGAKISRTLTNLQGATKLGLSSLGNVTQKANNAIIGGVGRELKAIPYQFTKKGKDYIDKTGVRSEQVAHEALFGEQGISGNWRKVTAPFFEPIEKSNRGEGALVGKWQAEALAKKAWKGDEKAAKLLKEDFGISNFKNGKLTEADQVRAGYRFVNRSQFRTRPQDLPVRASTNTGKVITQFRRYPYKQAEFLKNEVYDKALQGDFKPLIRLATVGAPLGIGSQMLTGAIRGAAFQQTGGEKALDLANDATGSSLLTSLAQGLWPNSKDANAYAVKALKTVGGPTVGDAANLVKAGFDATKKDFTAGERFVLNHVPVVGTPASNRLLPYGNNNTPNLKPKDVANATPAQIEAQNKKELNDYKNKKQSGDTDLKQLTTGDYLVRLGNKVETTSDKQKAQDKIDMYNFKKSGLDEATIGDQHYYTDQNGDAKKEYTFKHEYDLAKSETDLAMKIAKDDGDYAAWQDAAQKQLDALVTKRDKFNQKGQKDEVNKANKEIETLKSTMNKYIAYGGSFTKGKKSGSGGGSKSFSIAKVKAGSASVAKPKGVSVRKLGTPSFKTTGQKKLSVSKIPSSASTRKLG